MTHENYGSREVRAVPSWLARFAGVRPARFCSRLARPPACWAGPLGGGLVSFVSFLLYVPHVSILEYLAYGKPSACMAYRAEVLADGAG